MSDFIKVNFKNGVELVLHRADLVISKHEKIYAASKLDNSFNQGVGMEYYEITQEEYGRLCKKLGLDDE